MANVYKITQGQESVKLLNYYDNTEVEIPLDKSLTPAKNAERYYKKYNKQKRAKVVLDEQLKSAQDEENYLNGVLEQTELAKEVFDYDLIIDELIELEYIKTNKPKNLKEKQKPYRNYSVFGFNVRVGRNNIENDKLVGSAKNCDVWLHAKDYHSSHVIIETLGKEVPKNVIEISAQICGYYSKQRNGGKAEIVYTEKKNLKKPKGAKPGFWTYEGYKSTVVSPNCNTEFIKLT